MGEAERTLIVSSDGHAVAVMPEYGPYIPASHREDFAEFCEVFAREGARTVDPASLRNRLDEELVADWIENVIDPGRLAGQTDPHQRVKELDAEGIAAEVIFPDFGLPWELHPPLKAAIIGYSRSPEKIEIANKAHNRWLADFCSAYPDRLGGLAVVSFADVEDTVAEIRWAKEAGLVGIVLPTLPDTTPFFDRAFDPIWDVLEELEMPAASHTAISAVTTYMPTGSLMKVPHPACAVPIMTAQAYFFTQQILNHMVWGGVLERHPNLRLTLTEQGTGWVVSAMAGMDYSWESSYLRRDVREIVKRKPSEYFARQVFLGSSLFSRAEAEARHSIGVDKICIGMDYPHHEGTWGAGPGTTEYLRATLGAAGVAPAEARRMLGENAADLWGFDRPALADLASRIGPDLTELLTPPTEDHFPRGDVHKPLATAF
ncbi:amidohydrolase family protein [Sporichthya polymorpha]|uniref:amidohydrolase family protein n=1 Tax=Sporichthya polymorpha TaxID=35751 RepID=UPI00037E3E73|nr:amidohydrolase family protein [Sporichthya polymorpha]